MKTRKTPKRGPKDKVPEPQTETSYFSSHSAIQDLYEAAVLVAGGADAACLKAPLRVCQNLIRLRDSAQGQRVLEKARELHIDSECNIDIDDGTIINYGDGGWWVQGWCFVHDEELEENEP